MQIGIKYIIQSFKIIKIQDEFNSPITYSSSLINALGSTLFHYLITTTIGSTKLENGTIPE